MGVFVLHLMRRGQAWQCSPDHLMHGPTSAAVRIIPGSGRRKGGGGGGSGAGLAVASDTRLRTQGRVVAPTRARLPPWATGTLSLSDGWDRRGSHSCLVSVLVC